MRHRPRGGLRRRTLAAAALFASAAVAVLVSMPESLDTANLAAPPGDDLGSDPDAYLARLERRVAADMPIVPGAEKRITWHADAGKRTPLAVVYLHGFSATRQELAPVPARVARELAANLFETRLSGHGLLEGALSGVSAEDWLTDGVEALTVGRRLGEGIVLIGTSTGATLAIALSDHASFRRVEHLVLISPNLGPRDSAAEILLWPGGLRLARLFSGDTRTWSPNNERQARYWTTSYPLAAAAEMMRLVDLARSMLPLDVDIPLLVMFSPEDRVVDVARIEKLLADADGPRVDSLRITSGGDPSRHVLAGDILAPDNNDHAVHAIAGFVSAE